MPPMESDQESCTYADRLLVTRCEAVIVGRFQVPAVMVSSAGPKHKISGDFAGCGVRRLAFLTNVYPFGADAEHELSCLGQGPWLLEQEVGIPFG